MSYDEVMTFYKGPVRAAERLGLTRQAIFKWRKRGIPHPRQKHIQADSRGKLRADPKKGAK